MAKDRVENSSSVVVAVVASAEMMAVITWAVDGAGNLYVADTNNHLILAASLTLSLALTGCSPDLEDKFSAWAIGSERARAHLEHKQLSVDGFNIAWLEGGQGDTVFLIHGFQSNKDIWVRLARELPSCLPSCTLTQPRARKLCSRWWCQAWLASARARAAAYSGWSENRRTLPVSK